MSTKNRPAADSAQPPTTARRAPVWRGPEADGVTQSLLSRFLCCRERFRLLVVEGLRPAPTFEHRVEFGQMWHACEEALASERAHFGEVVGTTLWEDRLLQEAQKLCRRYRTQQEQVDHWYNVVKVTFPVYADWWARHPDTVERTPLAQEQVFNVPYALPSGRVVRLRGKFDAVDLIGKGKAAGIYLQENKTKGDVREGQIKRQLTFDLQTMLYLVALGLLREEMVKDVRRWCDEAAKGDDSPRPPLLSNLPKTARDLLLETSLLPIKGVRYNVIRRPLSGGKGSIVRHKPTKANPKGESKADYYKRLGGIIRDHPEEYFMRWRVEVSAADVAAFRRRFLDPVLEQLCDWWDWITDPATMNPFDGPATVANDRYGLHWQHPFGVYNVLDEGGSTDLDEYLASGSEIGLVRVDELFPELTPEVI